MSYPKYHISDETESGPPEFEFEWTYWLLWVLATTLGWVLGWVLLPGFTVGLWVGLLQWFVLRQRVRQQSGWWILASGVGWLVGSLLAIVLPIEDPVLVGALLGLGISAGQWFVLRRWVHRAEWWVIISTLSWTVASFGLLGHSLVGTIAGGVTGWALQLLLHHARLLASE